MVKIGEYNIRQRGLRGFEITLPRFFIEETNLKVGDTFELMRKQIDGKECIILVPKVN